MDWLRDVWEGVCEYGWKIGVATAAVLLVAALLYEFRRHFRIVRKGFGAALWTLQRSLVFIWFGLVVGALLYFWPVLAKYAPYTQIGVLGLAIFLIWVCIYQMKMNMGGVITFLGFPVRSVGHGAFLKLPLLEKIEEPHPMHARQIKIEKMSAETKDEVVVTFDVLGEYFPDGQKLITFLKYTHSQIEGAIKDRMGYFVSLEVLKYGERDEVTANIGKIGEAARDAFRDSARGVDKVSLEDFYGIKMASVALGDPAMPKEVAEARAKLEAQDNEEKRKDLQVKKHNTRVDSIMKAAEKKGSPISREKAEEIAHIQEGKVTKSVTESTENKKYSVDLPGLFGAGNRVSIQLGGEGPVKPGSEYGAPRKGFDDEKGAK